MPTTTDGAPKRAFSDTAWGKAALLAFVLVLAVVAARSCASRDTEISKEEATEIARKELEFTPDQVMTRFVPRGFQSRPTWAVSFTQVDDDGVVERAFVVVVDANDGHIIETRSG
jgi:hypothetical protein